MMHNFSKIFFLIIAFSAKTFAQGIPSKVNYEPDEGGYSPDYTPAKKLGRFDLSSKAANEPFRHLMFYLPDQKTSWGDITDFRDFGFRAEFQTLGKPKENSYADLNEAYFKNAITVSGQRLDVNPIYNPDPNRVRSAQGQTFSGVGGSMSSITISNLDEDAKYNPFLLSSTEIDLRARAVSNAVFGYLRWDIEAFLPYDNVRILKGRQVWNNGEYRHANNGGNNATFRNMSDPQFQDYVLNKWSEVFVELFQRTKVYSQGAKVWVYGWGPVQNVRPHEVPQFEANGDISSFWKRPTQTIWNFKNQKFNKSIADEADYLESWDFIPDIYNWAVTRFDATQNRWVGCDLIQLRNPIQNITSKGTPSRYSMTDIGANNDGNRKIKISLHGQDGTLRLADQDYRVIYENGINATSIVIPAGQSSGELQTSTKESTVSEEYRNMLDDIFLNRIWTNNYAARLHEPSKLGFVNWELTPRTRGLFTTDIFEQRVYDAVVAMANLQNFGIIHWDASLSGKLVPMVREALILAQKKIAPYKSHIENQTLCFVDISMDGGTTWTLGGYPDAPNQQRYNGWLLNSLMLKKQAAPLIQATYNTTSKTFLIAHVGLGTIPQSVSYKVRVRVPNNNNISYTTDLTTTRELKYSFFKL